MPDRFIRRGWQVLAVLVAVGVLLGLTSLSPRGSHNEAVSAAAGVSVTATSASGAATTPGMSVTSTTSTTSTTTTSAATASEYIPAATTTSASTASEYTTSVSTASEYTPSESSTTLPLFTQRHPLRVLAVGDSLATFPGYAIADLMKVYSGLQVKTITKQSSGLCRPDFYNWPQVLGRAVAEFRPHVTVVLLGANDNQPVRYKGHSAPTFSDTWKLEYAKRIEQFIQIATGAGGSVIWVGLPIMRSEKFSATEGKLNALYEAGCALHADSVYIDGFALFADADGRYAARLADASGAMRVMRAKDGIHFTMDGARRIADAVLRVLQRSYRLQEAPVPVTTTTGR
jgi:uncharacterized protein